MKLLLSLTLIFLVLYSQAQTNTAMIHYESLMKADSLYQAKDFDKAAMQYSQTFQKNLKWITNGDKYRAARAFAMVESLDSAFFYLNQLVVQLYYSNENQLLNDNHLVNLHSDKRWETLISLAKTNKEKIESRLNKNLMIELDSIHANDQKYRQQVRAIESKYGMESAEANNLWKTIAWQDSLNLILVTAMIDKYGWLGSDVVGSKGSTTLFLVIQHADLATQLKYLPLFREAVAHGKVTKGNLALLEDRVALGQGKSQLYGTQMAFEAGKWKLAPIADEKNVNIRRMDLGLEPLEIYAQRFKIQYQLPRE